MKRGISLALILTLVVTLMSTIASPTASAAAPQASLSQALDWLRAQQSPNGAFPGLNGSDDPGTSADVALAFAADGIDPNTVSAGDKSLVDFLREQAPAYAKTAAGAAKLTLASVAAGLDPHKFGGVDLISLIQKHFDAASGRYDQQLYVHSVALLALAAADVSVPDQAVQTLLDAQATDGGWSFSGNKEPGQTDSNTTAIVIQALVAAGRRTSPAIDAALGYLRAAQTDTGAFVYQIGGSGESAGDANSTALAVQAVLVAGQDPSSDTWGHALDALQKFQNPSGAFRYRDDAPNDNLLATVQAIPALAGKPLPVSAKPGFGRSNALRKAEGPAAPKSACVYYPQTRHNLCLGFRAFWLRYGGLAIYGYPLTEEFVEDGMTVQYFERARFEWHPGVWPDHYDVLLGRIGSEAVAGSTTKPLFQRTAKDADPSCYYFEATGHNVCEGFGSYWQRFGGLSTYGYPTSEAFVEAGTVVQYFERARFEWHPGVSASHYDVIVSRLGAKALGAH